MTEIRKLRVFLCHSSQDKPIVRELYQRLNAEGWIDPWLDEEKLLPGQDWDMEIEKAVEAADAVIVCLSKYSINKEGYVQKETRFVLDIALTKSEETIFVIPVRLEDCQVPRRLRVWQYVDYFPSEQVTKFYGRLKNSLQTRANLLDIKITQNQQIDFIAPVNDRPSLGLNQKQITQKSAESQYKQTNQVSPRKLTANWNYSEIIVSICFVLTLLLLSNILKNCIVVSSQFSWLMVLILVNIIINFMITRLINNDLLVRPNLVLLICNGALLLVGGTVSYYTKGSLYSGLYILFTIIVYLGTVNFAKQRDISAIRLGEKLLATLRTIDLQINYILGELNNVPRNSITRPIRRTLRYILSELVDILGIDSGHQAQLCMLVPKNSKFKVIAYMGIESYKIEKMEEVFRYSPEPISIAGLAMSQRRTIILNDLSDYRNPDVQYWIKAVPDDIRAGSLLAYPIIRGVGSITANPIAIICITSKQKNTFNEYTVQLMNYFSSKIEILQNLLEITLEREEEEE